MKLLLLSGLLLYSTVLFSVNTNANDINYVRKEFNLAQNNSKKANVLHAQLLTLKPAFNSLHYAYLGATEALLAKHNFNPFAKLNYVNSALEKLNKAISLNKSNIEIRFMRYSVETELPFYLGYSKHLEEDKNAIIHGLMNTKLTSENNEMFEIFAVKLYNSSSCNKEEKLLLQSIISACNQLQNTKN